VHTPIRGKVPRGHGSIIFDHECGPYPTAGATGVAGGRWRGVLCKGFGPDGKRRRYKVSGRTMQEVIEALKKKSEEIDAGLSTFRPYEVEAAAHDWLEYGLPIGAHAEGSHGCAGPAPSQDRRALLRDLPAGES